MRCVKSEKMCQSINQLNKHTAGKRPLNNWLQRVFGQVIGDLAIEYSQ